MIGILDSGVGGLGLVRALAAGLPATPLLFWGDTARSPYGEKSPETVGRFAAEGLHYLLGQGARAIVIASSTIASCLPGELRQRTPVPIWDPLEPAARRALACSRRGAIGVLASPATVASGGYSARLKALSPGVRVHSRACPLLNSLICAGWLKKPETPRIVKKCLHPLKVHQVDTLILAGAFLSLLQPVIGHKLGRSVVLVDAAAVLAETVVKAFESQAAPAAAAVAPRLVVTDHTPQVVNTARLLLRGEPLLEPLPR
ncbi:MAG: aspartate/glutamate racemase family protein [Desulfobacteraceae bacterium]